MDNSKKWIFPEKISFEEVSEFVENFKRHDYSKKLIFDLRNTETIHSSFIGFLINAKHNINKKNGELVLHLSYTVARILIMLNIIDYFSPEIIVQVDKKSA